MVLTDSDRISRVPPYLGYPPAQFLVSPTGLSPSPAGLSRPFDYKELLPSAAPQPRRNCLRRFSLVPFRSPLLGESLTCSLLLQVLRCFTSLGSLSGPMYSAWNYAALPAQGFPIRTSSDHSLVGGSPGLFAASHVLHRLRLPRHPPCALFCLVTSSSPRPPWKASFNSP